MKNRKFEKSKNRKMRKIDKAKAAEVSRPNIQVGTPGGCKQPPDYSGARASHASFSGTCVCTHDVQTGTH